MDKEKRKFKRLVFKIKQGKKEKKTLIDKMGKTGIEGKFTIPGMKDHLISADILNLSPAGIGINFKSNEPLNINAGDCIILEEIHGIKSLSFLSKIKAKIIWMVAYNPSRGTMGGLHFINISKSDQKKIQKFIYAWFQKKIEGV